MQRCLVNITPCSEGCALVWLSMGVVKHTKTIFIINIDSHFNPFDMHYTSTACDRHSLNQTNNDTTQYLHIHNHSIQIS